MSSNFNSFSPNSFGAEDTAYIKLRQDDSLIVMDVELKNKPCDNATYYFDTLDPLDLTGIELALLKVRPIDGGAVSTTVIGTPILPYEDGFVSFVWLEDNLKLDAGFYDGEIELTFANGRVETVPELAKFEIVEDF